MRIHQLGCRYVCTQSPDGELRYLRATRLSSLRLFWIFRNFADLHQHVLSPRQLQLILNCEALDDNARIDPEELIGTIELSAGPTKGFEPKSRPSFRGTQPIAHASIRGRSFAISAIATAATLVFLAVTFSVAQAHWGGHLANISSKSKLMARHLLPRMQGALRFRIVEPQQAQAQKPFSNPEQVSLLPSTSSVWEKAEIPEASVGESALRPSGATLQSAAYKYASESAFTPDIAVVVPHSPPKHGSISAHHSNTVPEVLPPAGPPESHPVLDDFSSVVRDTEVLLRAIVSPEGRVKEVKLLHGDATLGREAARIVRSWRYASRTGNTDGESRIRFKFTSDVTTVSFLDSGSPLQNR